jgi:hypothetical protein
LYVWASENPQLPKFVEDKMKIDAAMPIVRVLPDQDKIQRTAERTAVNA